MNRVRSYNVLRSLIFGGAVFSACLPGCVQTVPQDIVEAVESIDRDLMQLRAVELSPDDYAHFVHQWVTLKARVETEDDTIRWPWEPNDLEQALRQLHQEGRQTVTRLNGQREFLRRSAIEQLARVEDRYRLITSQVRVIDSRLVLGQKPVEADLLIKQARTFLEHGQYAQSLQATNLAADNLASQAALLSRELGRYASRDRIGQWQKMVQHTIDWSRTHRTTAIVVSKADRLLTLYRNGQKVLAYSIRLGYNGIREKQFQGDGATPEGRYRITSKRGQGQTQFYRALVLDYPNEDDRRRFQRARKTGHVPSFRTIGGEIEIHGGKNGTMEPTLGCVMLDNLKMASLFSRVDRGTPVTIVGALHEQNSIALALATLSAPGDET